jgi:hypothetical protein
MSDKEDDRSRSTVGEEFHRNSPQFNDKPTESGMYESLMFNLNKASLEFNGLFYFFVWLPFIYPVLFVCLGIPAMIYDAIFIKKA